MKKWLGGWKRQKNASGYTLSHQDTLETSGLSKMDNDINPPKNDLPNTQTLSILPDSELLIAEIMMPVYVKILTSGDMRHLGYGSDELNLSAWERIRDEWDATIMGDSASLNVNVYAEIKYIQLKIAWFNELIQAAQSLGAGEQFDRLLPEFAEGGFYLSSFDELPSIINQSKQLVIELERLTAQVQINEDKEGGKPLNKAFFVTCCERFSDYKKRSIMLEDITILQFCIHYKDWQDYYDRQSEVNN